MVDWACRVGTGRCRRAQKAHTTRSTTPKRDMLGQGRQMNTTTKLDSMSMGRRQQGASPDERPRGLSVSRAVPVAHTRASLLRVRKSQHRRIAERSLAIESLQAFS